MQIEESSENVEFVRQSFRWPPYSVLWADSDAASRGCEVGFLFYPLNIRFQHPPLGHFHPGAEFGLSTLHGLQTEANIHETEGDEEPRLSHVFRIGGLVDSGP